MLEKDGDEQFGKIVREMKYVVLGVVVKDQRRILQTVQRRKEDLIGQISCGGYRQGYVTGGWGRRSKQLPEYFKETEKKGSTRSHCVGNWFWKSLWTCRKTDDIVNKYKLLEGKNK